MELRRIGDVLLRSRASPLLPFLTPSIPLATWFSLSSHAQLLAANARVSSCPRRFVSSTSSSQASSPAAAPVPEDDEDNPPLESPDQIPNQSSATPSTHRLEVVNKLLDDAMSGRTFATAHTQTSRFKSPSAQTKNRERTSADALKDAYAVYSTPRASNQGMSSFDTSRMLPTKSVSSSQKLSHDVIFGIKRPAPLLPRLCRLGPSAGRSVEVDSTKGTNLTVGFQKLDIIVGINGVRRDAKSQRFHERPGLKRKRLKSERWRRKFKDGFRAIVDKVDTMRRQGW